MVPSTLSLLVGRIGSLRPLVQILALSSSAARADGANRDAAAHAATAGTSCRLLHLELEGGAGCDIVGAARAAACGCTSVGESRDGAKISASKHVAAIGGRTRTCVGRGDLKVLSATGWVGITPSLKCGFSAWIGVTPPHAATFRPSLTSEAYRQSAELAASQPAQPTTPAQTPRAALQAQQAGQQQAAPFQGLAQFPPGLHIPNRPALPQEPAVLQPLPHQWGATRSAIEAIARNPDIPAQDRAAAQQYLLEESHRGQELDMGLGQRRPTRGAGTAYSQSSIRRAPARQQTRPFSRASSTGARCRWTTASTTPSRGWRPTASAPATITPR